MGSSDTVTHAPIVLRPDNFTPPSRTPWGGSKIPRKYKSKLPISEEKSRYRGVGESWELSVEPDFPSLTQAGVALEEILTSDPEALLGYEADRGRASTALLVKWLDAGQNLSLQIHPADEYQGLGPGETGKAECWYVVEHEPGAGVYLGFQAGVTEPQLRDALRASADIARMLLFQPVAQGDVFCIEPGTPHAIGRGITLIEAQYVTPGHRGVTYRYWDWNRRYDDSGQLVASGGRPRPLHLEHALAVTSWTEGGGEALLRHCHHSAGPAETQLRPQVKVICGPESHGELLSSRVWLARMAGTGPAALPGWNALRALTVVQGEIWVQSEGTPLTVATGQTVAVPACLGAIEVQLRDAHALVCAVQDC